MSAGQRYAKTLDANIQTSLRHAIATMREAADDAERTMSRSDPTGKVVGDVLARLRNGHNNAMAYIESAVSAMADQIACLDAQEKS